ncbi:hypothetical protein pb186bvf_003897 [Paramecium bursaria]
MRIVLFISLIVLALGTSTGVEQKVNKYFIFTPECYDEFFINSNFFHFECLKTSLSKLLSYMIVILSVILKVPQILKIMGSKTVHGLSFDSVFFEAILLTFTIAYNVRKQNDFLLYGENVFILLQNFLISFLFKLFDKKFSVTSFLSRIVLFVLVSAPLFTPLVPEWIFDWALYINMGLLAFARVPQILTNLSNKHTGQLAFITTFLSFAGALSRAFTIMVSSADNLLRIYNLEGVFLNGVLTYQILIYWRNKPPIVEETQKKK